jgi:hypothetical protein
MTWRKHFKSAIPGTSLSPISGNTSDSSASFGVKNYQSQLPDVYVGHPNRIERYNQYEQMDQDSEVSAALDILAEFSTQTNVENGTAFNIEFNEKPTDNEIKIIKEQLRQWYKLNQFDKRIFKLFRNCVKYGDQVFVRDPETFKLLWTEMSKVTKVIVNESDGKSPEQYVLKELNVNLQNLTVTAVTTSDTYMNRPAIGNPGGSYTPAVTGAGGGSRFSNAKNESVINAEHVVHISLGEGLDAAWPFGNSVLENIFKVFKQKEMLEESILIYRIQRAPERRIFKIDVGGMPAHLAMAFVERVKNEVHQRRIPTHSGNGQNMMDATYNPISQNEDFFFPVSSEGKGSDVSILPGGCLTMDTKVPLLDGRTLTLTEMTEEYKNGKENWVYSCNPENGHIVPGIVSWAGVTQKSAKVMKITLDNGKDMIVTPDHKFPIIGKGTLRADQLSIGESMIPHNRRTLKITNLRKDYEQVYDTATKEWVFTHQMVADYFKDTLVKYEVCNPDYSNGNYEVRHHKDFDRYNNTPENLCFMSAKDHIYYHSQNMHEIWENHSDEEYKHRCDGISTGISNYVANLSDEDREIRAQNSRKAFKIVNTKLNEMLQTDPEFYDKFTTAQKEGWDKFRGTEEYEERNNKIGKASSKFMNAEGTREKYYANQEVKFDNTVLAKIQSMLLGKTSHQENTRTLVDKLNADSEFVSYYLGINKDTKSANWDKTGITESQLKVGVTRHGYKNWRQFRKEAELFNHKIISIEYLDSPIEVGTLTIDVDEKYHNYHTFALDCGVMNFNSNLGEISDLRFFTNKMFRGLKIPSSYLPTQTDEAQNTYSDGKVGMAMIQEWRFNQYCVRLQNAMATTLDREFKLFMRFRGINIDASVFDLKFNEPQNFTKYRQADIDTARIQSFTQIEQFPYLAKRFILTRYLGLSEEEMQENEQLWAEEHADTDVAKPEDPNLRSVGVSPSGISSDLGNMADMGGGEDMGGDMGGGEDIGGGEMPPAEGPM